MLRRCSVRRCCGYGHGPEVALVDLLSIAWWLRSFRRRKHGLLWWSAPVRERWQGRRKARQSRNKLTCQSCEYGRAGSWVVAPRYWQSSDALVIEDEMLYSAKIQSLKD